MTDQCKFVSRENETCQGLALGNGLCFWHDAEADKSGLNLTDKLQVYARTGGLTKGLKLSKSNLQGIDLVNRNKSVGFDFSDSDFYRANLKDAHLFNMTINNGSLMKADLKGANLHCANLEGTNLLGTKLQNAKLDNIHVGKKLIQETLGQKHLKEGQPALARDNFEQAEEVYRNLRKCSDQQGLYSLTGLFGYSEAVMRRYLMRKWSLKWAFSHVVDWLCGYGEKPENTVLFSLYLILLCAIGYFFIGMNQGGEIINFDSALSLTDNLSTFSVAIYYSVVTFTTLGYGDITPFGVSRFIAVIEAFLGAFSIALFVVVFVKRMSR